MLRRFKVFRYFKIRKDDFSFKYQNMFCIKNGKTEKAWFDTFISAQIRDNDHKINSKLLLFFKI